VTFYVFTVFIIVTFYEGFVLLAGNRFFNCGASIHYLVLNCIVSFGSNFFTSFETLLERGFHFAEETGFVLTTL